MRRNCNLELSLLPMSDSHDHHQHQSSTEEYLNKSRYPDQQQKLTIFYNGNICVCDVTEFQARAIILLASKEMEDKLKATTTPKGSSEPASPTSLPSPIYSPNTGLSMKRSLQRFLQKRNHRIQATYPYNINNRQMACRVDY